MATDPDDGDEEWRFSLEDLEDEDSEDTSSEPTESPDIADGSDSTGDSEGGESIDAGVAGRLDLQEELKAQEINLENALFVVLGVVLAIAFFLGFLNLFP